MNHAHLKELRRNLTLHFAVIAWLTAMLVASGSGGYYLPVLIFVMSLIGFIFVDTLGWFELGRVGSYVAMSIATCLAIGSYIYSVQVTDSEAGQLAAVAGLLIYPECVLFLQGKSLRVYEQLAIFLLLEMIVAALINDNLFFGVLLTPIMLLWVSSLFLFSRYATLVHVDPTVDTHIPILVELIYQRFVKPILVQPAKRQAVSSHVLPTVKGPSTNPVRRAIQTLPIGVGALVFAATFFYLLPRTSPGAFRAGLGIRPQVGLPTELRMGIFGRLLQDPSPVMRVSLKSQSTGELYPLEDPPYLRALVFDVYHSAASQGERRLQPTWGTSGRQPFHPQLRNVSAVRDFSNRGVDLVVAEFDIRREYASMLYAIPPAYTPPGKQRIDLHYDRFSMLLDPLDPGDPVAGKSLVYTIGSAGFDANQQLPVAPAFLPRQWVNSVMRQLTFPLGEFPAADEYRRDLLRRQNVDARDVYQIAKAYERHFVYSGEFTYTLDLRPPLDAQMDPIEDFIVNQPQGHCQYFASAMVALLRQSEIPSRIVVGYRPTEFNSYGYFPVKQSDAHAWVEALFQREQLVGTELERWLTDDEHYWVRFDPTPSSSGGDVEIVRQRGQAMDYAEKLWKDYVVDAQKLSGENSIYAPVSENSEQAYKGLIQKFSNLRDDLKSGRLFSQASGIGFAWPLAVLITLLGTTGVGTWQLLVHLPRWAPRLARRLGLVRRTEYQVTEPFYARCLKILEQRGLKRAPFETPQEFVTTATVGLDKSDADVGSSLNFLTQLYYRLRFGASQSLSAEDARAVDEALCRVESIRK